MSRWRLGETDIEALISSGELQTLVGDAANGEAWLARATHTLQTAKSISASDPLSAYVLGYDAARQAAVGLLAHQGLRPTTRGGHYAVEQAMTAQFQDAFTVFGALRRRRNRVEYPSGPVDDVTADEIEEALAATTTMLEKAQMLLPNLGLFG